MFRHSYLALLVLNDVHPKEMQGLVDHYSSQIAMDIYTHVNMDAKKKAVVTVSRCSAFLNLDRLYGILPEQNPAVASLEFIRRLTVGEGLLH